MTYNNKLRRIRTIVFTLVSLIFLPISNIQAANEIAVPDPLVNGGFEQEASGGNPNVAFDWQNFGNGNGYVRVQDFANSGSWSMKASHGDANLMSGAYQRIDLNQTAALPVSLTAYVKGVNVTPALGAFIGAALYAEIHMTDGSVAFWNSTANFGTFDWRFVGFNTRSLTFVNVSKPISHIFVVPVLAQASGTVYFDDIQVKQFEPDEGAVTIMFDDGNKTDITVGLPALQVKNFKATTAIPTGEIGDEGKLSGTDLNSLVNAGWELASHSVNHLDLTTLSASQLNQELADSKNTLKTYYPNTRNIALPLGAYNGFVMAEAAKHYRSARAFELGSNPEGLYAFDVKVRAVKSNTTVSEVQSWVNEAKNDKRWVILSFHALAASGDDEFHTEPGVFGQMVEAVSQSGVKVVTYDEGLNMFGAGGAEAPIPNPNPNPGPQPNPDPDPNPNPEPPTLPLPPRPPIPPTLPELPKYPSTSFSGHTNVWANASTSWLNNVLNARYR
jgi:peptidoglycan/xylan/chitin deacetylase (PgdA/CDA1 family)